MIHEFVLLVAGIVGFGVAAYLDLRYTEFPDWLPYSMIITGLVVWLVYSIASSNLSYFYHSVAIGIFFLAIGIFLYLTKQWGDGDAWLLGAMGFMFPVRFEIGSSNIPEIFPFPFVILFNFFVVGFAYLVVYSSVLGIVHKRETAKFLKGMIKEKSIIYTTVIVTTAVFAGAYYLQTTQVYFSPLILYMPVLAAFLIFFAHYGRFVEEKLFRKRISVRKLKPGDVLSKERWRGLTEKEIKKLQENGGFVWIKEGIRFAPVFIITLVVTIIYGSLIYIFV